MNRNRLNPNIHLLISKKIYLNKAGPKDTRPSLSKPENNRLNPKETKEKKQKRAKAHIGGRMKYNDLMRSLKTAAGGKNRNWRRPKPSRKQMRHLDWLQFGWSSVGSSEQSGLVRTSSVLLSVHFNCANCYLRLVHRTLFFGFYTRQFQIFVD